MKQKYQALCVGLFALALAGCAGQNAGTSPGVADVVAPQTESSPPVIEEAPAKQGISEFVLATLPRTWFSAANTTTRQACLEQLVDAGQFYNALPGVGGNPPSRYGLDGDRLHNEYLPIMKASIEAMEPWCTALGFEADQMTFPDMGSPNFAAQVQLQMDTLFAVRRNFPRVSDGLTFVAGVYCEQTQVHSALTEDLYSAFVLEQEQRTRRLIARDPSFGDIMRNSGVTVEEGAATYIDSLFQSPAGLNRHLC